MPSNKGRTIPSSPAVKKMTVAQSKEIVEKQDVIIKTLQQDSANKSLHFVRDRVTENQTS